MLVLWLEKILHSVQDDGILYVMLSEAKHLNLVSRKLMILKGATKLTGC
jgi:hypothetical protein